LLNNKATKKALTKLAKAFFKFLYIKLFYQY